MTSSASFQMMVQSQAVEKGEEEKVSMDPELEPQTQTQTPAEQGATADVTVTVTVTEHANDASDSEAEIDAEQVNHKSTTEMRRAAHHYLENPFCCDLTKCENCGNLPLRQTHHSMSFHDVAAWEFDGGLYDIIRQMNGEEMGVSVVPPTVADETVEACVRHLRRLKRDLIREGLLSDEKQNYTGASFSCTRAVAPLDVSEVEAGVVLGTGAFSSVFEVVAFNPRIRYIEGKGMEYSQKQEDLRQFLADRAQVHPSDDHLIADYQTKRASLSLKKSEFPDASKNVEVRKNGRGFPYTRYAIKHLRNGMVTRSPEKFKRAAVDLVLEAQLLLILDHPNIVSVHGFSSKGPEAYRSGDPRHCFLVLEKLPLTLELQMLEWRSRMTKYQARLRRRTSRQAGALQVSSWVRRRLGRKTDEQQGDPAASDKYAIKLHDLWRERLKAASQIANAIAYMHSKRLIHRDLKSGNIGFDALNDVKLFDMGLSRLLPSCKDDLTCIEPTSIGSLHGSETSNRTGCLHDGYVMSRVGTQFYMAPEVRLKDPYNLSADVYSFGVVLWELLALSSVRDLYHQRQDEFKKLIGKQRKGGKQAEEAYAQFKQVVKTESASSWLPICPCWPAELQNLIRNAWSTDGASRPSMDEVKEILQRYVEGLTNFGSNAQ